ncbi:MAG TPA: globin domain-containing protein [Gemmatimonadaceae bacterium]|nr:globin domain-containing protein [Gemmatimonadaceae bacterium]
MSPDQVLLVRSSWTLVNSNPDVLAERFYSHLFEIDESASRLFAAVDMTAQRAKLTQSFDVIVHALDEPERLLPALAPLARRHTGYGVEVRHFDSVRDALLWALADTYGSAFTADVREAWSEAYALVASVMKRAFERPAAVAR